MTTVPTPQPTPQEIAFNAFYLPVFCKVAADYGFPLETPEAIQEALDLTANGRKLAASQGTSQIKQASHAMKRAVGITVPNNGPRFDFSKSAATLVEDPDFLKAALAL